MNTLSQLLILALGLSLLLGIFISMLDNITELEMGRHAMDQFLELYPIHIVVFLAVVLAPLLEELIFRGPMVFFRNSRFFPLVFYSITAIFAFYHITNFDLNTNVLLLSPLLVAPQFCVGLLLGYMRVRHGLAWAMVLHAAYNGILLGPVMLLKFLDIPLP